MPDQALNHRSVPYSSGLARRPDDHPVFAALADAAPECIASIGTIYVWQEYGKMHIACVTSALVIGTDEFAVVGFEVDRTGNAVVREYGILDYHASGPTFRHYEPVSDKPDLTIHDLLRIARIKPAME